MIIPFPTEWTNKPFMFQTTKQMFIDVPNIQTGWWFQPTPLKNMSLSVGIIIPNIWKNHPHVPNHQPANIHTPENPEDLDVLS